ncbi:MAG: deoxyribonuclease IV [Candidatus Micrarchaeia archaeon]
MHIGFHVSVAKSIDLAFDRALALGCTALQLFVTNPRSWRMSKLDAEETSKFIFKETIPAVAHMPYLPNLASPRREIYEKSIAALKANMGRCNDLEIKYLISHIGSTLGSNKGESLNRVVNAIKESIDFYEGMLLLENEAGQRNSIGSKVEEMREIYNEVGSAKLGFCLDTCHSFESGYDIRKKEVMEKIATVLGKERIKVIHLNDAKFPLGSCKDRHENLGFGYIGNEGFKHFFDNKWTKEKIIILETPYSSNITPQDELNLAKMLASQ